MLELNNKRGMTLIEVVAAIGIVGIMTSVSLVSFISAKRNAALDAAAEELEAVLREAQNYSLTGKEIIESPNVCPNYRVTLTNGSSNYVLRAYRDSGAACNSLNATYRFRNGVQAAISGYTSFAVPHGNITTLNFPVVSTSWRRITISKSGINRFVCYNTAGLIKKTLDPNCVN